MSSTVSFGSMTVDSSNDSADQIIAALDPKPEKDTPKILKDRGKEPELEEEKDEVSEAASTLGKKGGKAAAKARKAAGEKGDIEEDAPEPKSKTAKAEGEDTPAGEKSAENESAEAEKKAAKAKEVDEEGLTERGRKRIEQATSAAAALKRENARLMAELQRREAQPRAEAAQAPEQRAEPKAPPADMPKMEDFENFEDYLNARDTYRDSERDKREAKSRQEAEFHATVEYALDNYESRVKKAVADNPEIRFDQRILMVPESFAVPPGQKVGPSNVIKDEIVKSEMPAQLIEHFSQHPEDWQRIAGASMSVPDPPGFIAREIARLEGRLGSATAGSSQPTPSKSKAKPPFQPVKGSPHTDSGEPDENADLSAFLRRDGQRRLRSSR